MIIEQPKLKQIFIKKIETILGAKNYSIQNTDRLSYARDANPKSALRFHFGQIEKLPDIVVWPSSDEQIQKLVKLAATFKVPIIPYGGGSGVCGGTLPVFGGMVIDMKKMRHVLDIDTTHLKVRVQTGIMGQHLEDALNQKGFTLGHFPSSIKCATLGGYLASRSAGQQSSRYGKIEDMVLSLKVITGAAEILETRSTAQSGEEDLANVFLGSEGTLGLITEASLRIYPLPPKKLYCSYLFGDMKTAMEATRRIMQSGIRPSIVRVYDELDSLLFFGGFPQSQNLAKKIISYVPSWLKSSSVKLSLEGLKKVLLVPRGIQGITKVLSQGCLVVVILEGHEKIINEEKKTLHEISSLLEARDLGSEPALYWMEHRYGVAFKASPLFNAGFLCDTVEIAFPWEKAQALYTQILKAISPYAMVMGHLSHAYQDGGSLYFTFITPLKGEKRSHKIYELIWQKAMQACQKEGGVISHHHGIGRIRAKFMVEEWGELGIAFYKRLKKKFDPDGILNPGKLLEQKIKAQKKQAA